MSVLLPLHVVVSFVALAAGIGLAAGLLGARRRHGAGPFFLWTTILTSLTGFVLPADRILPSHVVGAISLVLLAVAAVGLVPAAARPEAGAGCGSSPPWRRST